MPERPCQRRQHRGIGRCGIWPQRQSGDPAHSTICFGWREASSPFLKRTRKRLFVDSATASQKCPASFLQKRSLSNPLHLAQKIPPARHHSTPPKNAASNRPPRRFATMAAACTGRCKTPSIPAASAMALSPATSTPVRPLSISTRGPSAIEATTGRRAENASSTTLPSGSTRDETDEHVARRQQTQPCLSASRRKCTRSATPACLASRSSPTRSGSFARNNAACTPGTRPTRRHKNIETPCCGAGAPSPAPPARRPAPAALQGLARPMSGNEIGQKMHPTCVQNPGRSIQSASAWVLATRWSHRENCRRSYWPPSRPTSTQGPRGACLGRPPHPGHRHPGAQNGAAPEHRRANGSTDRHAAAKPELLRATSPSEREAVPRAAASVRITGSTVSPARASPAHRRS